MNTKYLLVISVVCLVFVYAFYRLANLYTFNDYVVNIKSHDTDAIDYQLIGVNIVDGYGITAHFIEDYSHYKIGVGKVSLENKFKFFSERFFIRRNLHVWKPPGYPLFLAFIYKFAGISPYYIKFIQLILLALAASFMPLIGFFYWRRTGIISGVIASLLFINFYSPNPTDILAEVLYVFLFSVWILLFSIWEKMSRMIITAMLGIILGFALLVKGTCVFIAVLFPMYLLFRLKHLSFAFKHAFVFVFCLTAMILPWSIYASIKTHELVPLCSQIIPDLLDGNNEQSIQTGGYTPEWAIKNSDRFYKNQIEKETHKIKALTTFLNQNYKHIPQLLANKLKAAFFHPVIFILFLMVLYYMAAFYFKSINSDQASLIPIFPLIFFINIFLITLIYYGMYRLVVPFIYPLLIPAAYLPFYLAKILYRAKA